MSVQLTKQSFRKVLIASGLVTADRLNESEQNSSSPIDTAEAWSQHLIQDGDLTSWQAEKLLQARHRGFQLGQYQLRSRLARGGMSTIYVAREKATGRDCVLKVLPLSRVSEASYLARFQREARITIGLIHPNVIRVFGLHCESDGKADIHFIAMELLHGKNLAEIVNRDGPMSTRRAADIIRQAANGLAFAHAAGLVHRDVKPANFVLTTDNVIKMLDLGLASANSPEEENLTRQYDERVLGTADYLSPEQAVDSHRADSRSDIYALGCTLYFLLTGRPPFPEGLLAERILAHQTKEPVPISNLRQDVPPAFQTILERMLIKDRRLRIQSAQEVAERFANWLDSIADDSRFDQEPDKVPELSSAAGKSQQAAPTQTQTDTQPLPSTPVLASNKDSALSGVYTPEFETFLRNLDDESGIRTVVDEAVRDRQLREMSHLPEKKGNNN
jgi:serine/threonine protein kinase